MRLHFNEGEEGHKRLAERLRQSKARGRHLERELAGLEREVNKDVVYTIEPAKQKGKGEGKKKSGNVEQLVGHGYKG